MTTCLQPFTIGAAAPMIKAMYAHRNIALRIMSPFRELALGKLDGHKLAFIRDRVKIPSTSHRAS